MTNGKSGDTKYGTLKIITSVRPEMPLAGESLTASARIENHFDKPVEIKAVESILPAGFKEEKRKPEKQAQKTIGATLEQPEKNPVQRIAGYFINPIKEQIAQAAQENEAQYVLPVTIDTLKQKGAGDTTKTISPIILQPGDSTVQNFMFRTRRALFTMPGNYHMDIRVTYEFDNETHVETIPVSMQIRPPLRAVVWGAVLGGFLGNLGKELQQNEFSWDWKIVLRFGVAILFSGVGVIFFTRKSGIQALPISVEDFWGGLISGFLIGYFGSSYFTNMLTPSAGTTTPTATT